MIRIATIVLGPLIVAIAAGCAASSAAPTTPPSFGPNTIGIWADDRRFSADELTAPADTDFRIVFENREAAPHNVSIYRDASLGEPILVEEPFGGPRTVTYEVPALVSGTYFFRCDVHPDMHGTLTVP
jgi:plastocyanin